MNRDKVDIVLGFLGGVISLLYIVTAFVYTLATMDQISMWMIFYFPGLGVCILVILGATIALKGHKRIGTVLLVIPSAIGFIVFGGWLWVLVNPLMPFKIPLIQFTSVSGWIVLSLVGGYLLLSTTS